MIHILILIIIVFITYIIVKMHYENHNAEVDYVTTDLDQRSYLVRNLPNKDDAAKLLALIRERLTRLVAHLHVKYPQDKRIGRLLEKFDPDHITESSANSEYTSYSINKGEKIVFCLRQRDEREDLLDINTMMFVAIHELSHIMTESIGHTQEFWDNMKFLLDVAMSNEVQVYRYQPYHTNPQQYCGTMISDTPLKL